MPTNRFLDRAGFLRLLRVAESRHRITAERDRFLFYFLGVTGLRISEALSLRVRDLLLEMDPPAVRVSTLKRRQPVTEEVYLDPKAVREVRSYVKRVLPMHSAVTGFSFLFPREGASGESWPMTRSNAGKLFRYYAARAGLPKGITLHSLRHFRGTTLYQTTKDLRFTQLQLRHRSLSSTQIYLHLSPTKTRHYLKELAERPQD